MSFCTLHPSSPFFFFFNDTATTEIYTLSLHDALPISRRARSRRAGGSGWRGRGASRSGRRRPPSLAAAGPPPRSLAVASRLRPVDIHHGPHLNAPVPRPRIRRSHLNGLVEISGLDQVVAAELFLGLGEGPVGRRELAISYADRGGGLGRLQPVRPDVVTALLDVIGELHVLTHPLVRVGLRPLRPLGLVRVDQAQVLHSSLRIGVEWPWTPASRSGQPEIDTGPPDPVRFGPHRPRARRRRGRRAVPQLATFAG